jgi:hypothetical protein
MTIFALACAAAIFIVLQPPSRQAHSLGEELQKLVEDMYWVATEHLGGMKIAKAITLNMSTRRTFSPSLTTLRQRSSASFRWTLTPRCTTK